MKDRPAAQPDANPSAQAIAVATGLHIYPLSVQPCCDGVVFLARRAGALTLGFCGPCALPEGLSLTENGSVTLGRPCRIWLGAASHANALAVRRLLAWAAPVTAGLRLSAGLGDRLGGAARAEARAADFAAAFAAMDYTLKPRDIVLVRSGAAPFYGTADYLVKGCGMGREATLWLLERGVKIVGTDAWSWDRPLPFIAKDFARDRDPSVIWEGHFAGIEKEYYHMEKMANLDKLPATGFKVACFPIKIKGASAGWTRPVALLP